MRTPHIDQLQRGGTLFSQVSSQVPLTLPSHVSLLTSTYPFSNGVEDNGQHLGPGAITLATLLKANGYRTAAFVGGFVLDQRFGLSQGFDTYNSPFDLTHEQGKDPGDIKRPAAEVISSALQWLGESSDRPFFVFLHLYDLHTPYQLSPALRKRFEGSDYDIELGYVDEQLGTLWEFLNRRDLLKRVVLVFVSDHGESLGEHGESTHGYFVYQSTLRVPLIVHWPAWSQAFADRMDEPVSVLDVAPTILRFARVSAPAQFQGRNLLGLLGGKKAVTAEEIYSESLYGHRHFGTGSLRCIRVGKFKYIETPRPELYDLAADPGELHNLYSTHQSLAASLRERLSSVRSRYRTNRAATGSERLSPETVERLASLGYVAASTARAGSPDSGPDPKDRIVAYEKYGRALALSSAGRLTQADEILRQLLAADPGLTDVRVSLGLDQQRMGRHAEAAQSFQEVLQADPANVLAHYDLAVSYFSLRRLDNAIRELRAALALDPRYTHAEELLGNIFLAQKDYNHARNQFNHLLTVDPGNYAAHYNLGVLALLENDWDEGLRHLQAALRTDASSVEAHNALGSLYLRKGDLEQARNEFIQAVALAPKYAWAHYNLGLVFRRQKRVNEAAREFRLAVDSDPQFQAARQALEQLAQDRP